MNKKIFMTILVGLIAVSAFSGVGYAFTAMTYNLDNSAQVEYTVLDQSSFTFNDDAELRYYSYVDNSTGGILYYMLNGGHDGEGHEIPLIHLTQKLGGGYYANYWGMSLGSTQLTINLVNNDSDYAIISIPMGNFKKQESNNWRYFLKVSHTNAESQVDYVE